MIRYLYDTNLHISLGIIINQIKKSNEESLKKTTA